MLERHTSSRVRDHEVGIDGQRRNRHDARLLVFAREVVHPRHTGGDDRRDRIQLAA